jgi:GTP1/Obg family GTP-binding protein
MTHDGEPATDLTRVLMDIREIKVLLTERQKGVDKNAEDIAKAFTEIAAMAKLVSRQEGSTKKLEGDVSAILEVQRDIKDRLRALEKTQNRMSWIFTVATTVVGAAAAKFFLG